MSAKDYDPRIVDFYDEDNPDGADHDYYRSLAHRRNAQRILDLGCGTGILTVTLAQSGRAVIGVDPSASMLEYARSRPGASKIRWILGDSRNAPDHGFDLVVMTGNVAQHIPSPQWEKTLNDLHRIMHSGGMLAFESRNPACRAWENWTTSTTTRSTRHGLISEWSEAVAPDNNGQVLYRTNYHFMDSGETVVQESILTFRDKKTLGYQLQNAGFEIHAVWGDWCRTPFDGTQPIMVFEAVVPTR